MIVAEASSTIATTEPQIVAPLVVTASSRQATGPAWNLLISSGVICGAVCVCDPLPHPSSRTKKKRSLVKPPRGAREVGQEGGLVCAVSLARSDEI